MFKMRTSRKLTDPKLKMYLPPFFRTLTRDFGFNLLFAVTGYLWLDSSYLIARSVVKMLIAGLFSASAFSSSNS